MEGKEGESSGATAATNNSSREDPNAGGGTNAGAPPSSKISWKYLGNEGKNTLSSGEKSAPLKRGREDSDSVITPEQKKLNSRKSPTKKGSVSEEPEENVDDDEAPDLTDQELADYMQKMGIQVADPSSFTDAIKSKPPRKDYPFLIYLQSTKTRRERITFKDFELFMDFFGKQYITLPMEERSKVNLDWHDYHMGRGLLAASDQPTAEFIKDLAEHFTVGEKVFKGWLKTEFGDRFTYKMWLPGSIWCKKSLAWTMTFIFRTVNVVLGDWKVTKFEKTPKRGVFVIFEADAKLASSIYYLNGLGYKKRNIAEIDVGYGNAEIKFKLMKGGQDEIAGSGKSTASQQEEVIMSEYK